jgi:hypothetical protein
MAWKSGQDHENGGFHRWLRLLEGVRPMPKYPPNRLPLSVPKKYFELRRAGLKGAAAARHVGVSTSCGSVWFIKAGRMLLPDKPIDERYLNQDDRVTIAQGLLAGRTASAIAGEIAKHPSTVYREISRGRGPDGTYNPWWSHNQAILRRRRPKPEKLRANPKLRDFINDKLKERWSPQQITRHLACTQPGQPAMNACRETIYRALYNGLLDKPPPGCGAGAVAERGSAGAYPSRRIRRPMSSTRTPRAPR